MDVPNKPNATGIALHPPGPAAVTRTATARGTPTNPSVVVVHSAQKVTIEKRPGMFRLFLGLLLALAGAALVACLPDGFRRYLADALPAALYFVDDGVEALLKAPPGEVMTRSDQFIHDYGHIVKWAPQLVGGLLLLLAGWCLRKRLALFIVGSAAVYATVATLSESFDWQLPIWTVAIFAAAIGYLIQCGRTPAGISVSGMLGLAMVCLAVFGLAIGFFDWPGWTAHVSTGLSVFVADWNVVFLWATILLLTAVGALLTRERLPRLLIGALLVAAIVLLFRMAYVEMVHFPELGENVQPQPRYSLRNLALWQWLALAELIILAAVMVYKGAGAGGLTVAVAALWLFSGLQADQTMSRIVFARLIMPSASRQIESLTVENPSSPGHRLAVPGTAAPGVGFLPTQPIPAADDEAAQFGDFGHGRRQLTTADVVSAITPAIWIYATAVLIGVIAGAGLRMMIGAPEARWWLHAVLWLFVGAFATCVAMRWPIARTTTIDGWLAALTTHPIHREVILLVATLSAAVTGLWSLRGASRYHTWLYAAATAVFIGTLLSFIALGVMIRWGGFPALPVQSYIVLAVAQSALMWVLLMHGNFSRTIPATTR